MEFDDFGDLFGEEAIEEDKTIQNEENDQEKRTAKAKNLESVWEKTEDETKIKRKIRRPQPKLSERELTSDKGIESLKSSFDNFNFPSECDPYQKLEILLNKMECWAHNLFPKMNFADCLERIEKLGRKRLVQATMKKLRPGFSSANDDEFAINEDENNKSMDNFKDDEISLHKLIDSSDDDDDNLDKYLSFIKTSEQSNSQKEIEETIKDNDSDGDSEIMQITNIHKKRRIITEDD
ncbi:Swi3 domain-containing protein [Meloidogyne graminicola]|uniref:TIMELESS-interacting protein n=1 Tax=Meloidogyne graminicola TaxID=189291 RepID=A0A8S9ZWU1_9BILA|nr:Swi3 domain-containing protein [Meloidogyne graminicola]